MDRKTVVITGASDGIGAAAARELAEHGHEVAVVGRSREKTEAVAAEVGGAPFVADFARLTEVRALADALGAQYPRIDVLANNAGGVLGSRRLTEDGFEATFQVNHLAGYLLTRLLLPTLTASRASVVQTSSLASRVMARYDPDDLQLERGYSERRAYGNAKLANILFTRELQRRHGGDGISAAAFHPGIVGTNFASESSVVMRALYRTPLSKVLMTSPAKGADQLVWLAEGEPGTDWPVGQYFDGRRVSRTSRVASDEGVAARLWDESAAMVGLEP
ncbi:SDR family NAD(P)-dependent oxidoreductase [Janibacter melonis]|uniref:SDR family NAD(P)-dependent oxidoreductase n=1 Tax=Janibacter melonis TaxID=262209 RepID=UPI00174A27DD|nr:SDR family NAD(P)-dependent oxidoreductase [Janibacter melonis]